MACCVTISPKRQRGCVGSHTGAETDARRGADARQYAAPGRVGDGREAQTTNPRRRKAPGVGSRLKLPATPDVGASRPRMKSTPVAAPILPDGRPVAAMTGTQFPAIDIAPVMGTA